jgi:lipopolysaccharide/colanic/teichoic acid biosynthesis glycosyltransferase
MLSVQPRPVEAQSYAPARVPSQRPPASYSRPWALALFVADALVLATCAVGAAVAVSGGLEGLRARPADVALLLGSGLVWLLVFERAGLYRATFSACWRDEVYASVAGIMLGSVPAFALAFVPAFGLPRTSLVMLAIAGAVGTGTARAAFYALRARPAYPDGVVRELAVSRTIDPGTLCACRPATLALRRACDLVLVVPALIVLAPVLSLIALVVALDSGLPVVFRQTRVGRLGKPFEILKFRTMPLDAERATGAVWAPLDEGRATRVGRFLRRTSLDELPQLFNVLRGEMALVGPRPERPVFVEQFRTELRNYDDRHLVAPGITGWSHVNMRRNIDISAVGERLAYDLFYVEHWSPLLDASILVKTLAEFLFHRAA